MTHPVLVIRWPRKTTNVGQTMPEILYGFAQDDVLFAGRVFGKDTLPSFLFSGKQASTEINSPEANSRLQKTARVVVPHCYLIGDV